MKMETPKMDVVRFQEADVIVASGEDRRQFSTLSGWGVDPIEQASVSFKTGLNGTETVHDYAEIHSTPDMYGLTYDNGTSSIALSELAKSDAEHSEFNGLYIYTGNGTYTWFNGQ